MFCPCHRQRFYQKLARIDSDSGIEAVPTTQELEQITVQYLRLPLCIENRNPRSRVQPSELSRATQNLITMTSLIKFLDITGVALIVKRYSLDYTKNWPLLLNLYFITWQVLSVHPLQLKLNNTHKTSWKA